MDKYSRIAKPVSNVAGIACDTDDPAVMPLAHLEARICQLAGHLAAATRAFLLLVADFDAREGWRAWEMPSCAAWLAWKCQVAPGTAKDHVRVARALKNLPVIRGEFAAGRFSYSKVRALARIATPQTEQGLVDMAEPSPGTRHSPKMPPMRMRTRPRKFPRKRDARPTGGATTACGSGDAHASVDGHDGAVDVAGVV